MHRSSTKSEKSQFSIQSSDTKSHLDENISTSTSQNKEILINKGHIYEIENLIFDMKEGLSSLNKKITFIEEFFKKNFKRKADDPEFIFSEKISKINSKTAKTAIRSEQLSSKTKSQKSILNLGFIKTYKVTDKTLKSKRKDSETEIVQEKLNLNSKLNDVDMNNRIEELEEDNKSNIDNQEREQTIVIPLKVTESRECSEHKEMIENEENKESNNSHINEIYCDNSNKNVNDSESNLLVTKPNASFTSFNTDAINKAKQKIDLEYKSINYNQKFFDYKTLHKEKEKETFNLKTKHDSSDYISNYKRLKNDWIRKESDCTKKVENDLEKYDKIDLHPFETNEYKQEKLKSKIDRKIQPDKFNYINPIPNKTYENTLNGININKDESDLKKLIEMNHGLTPPSNKNYNGHAIDSRFNSVKKIESSQLSLAFDSNINSKEKIELSNNFVNIPREEGKKSTRFSDFLKLKEEDNINISKIRQEFQPKLEKRNGYELDLCTLEETFDEFYDLKPKMPVNKTKKNLFIPNNYKANSESNINLKTNAFISNRNGVIRNKKEREKMNGYKCEICESEKTAMQFVRHVLGIEKMRILIELPK